MIAGATFLIAARTIVIVFVLFFFFFSMFFYEIRSLCARGGHCTYYASMCIEKHTPHVLYFIHDEPNGTAGRAGRRERSFHRL